MNTNLMRAAAAALIAALAAGAVLPGEAAAKLSGKPPISKSPPPSIPKKKIYMNCSVIHAGQNFQARITNSTGHALMSGTRIIWHLYKMPVGGVIRLYRPFRAGGHAYRYVPLTTLGCYAWFMGSFYR